VEGYNASCAILSHLAEIDPHNAGWHREVAGLHDRIGDVQKTLGSLGVALESFRVAHAIRKRLTETNPNNTEWQSGLGLSHERIGAVLHAQGKLDAALESYEVSHAIYNRLAEADPSIWEHDLALSLRQIAEVLQAQDRRDAALDRFRASHAILKRLTEVAPNNVDWQIDLAGSHWKFALLAQDPGENCQRVIDILSRLERSGRLAAEHKPLLEQAQAHLGSRDLSGALEAYQATGATSHTILAGDKMLNVHIMAIGPLTRADRKARGNATDAQHDPGVSHPKIGDAGSLEDRLSAAFDQIARSHFQSHAKLDPRNAERWLGDPDRFEADVNERLLAMGWARGRDMRVELDDWLAPRLAELSEKFSKQKGTPPYAPFPAAVAVMREFGGLVSWDNGPGQTMARMPFVIYPAPHDDLIGFAPDVQKLSETIGSRAFQVGEAERGLGALVVDESGRVFLVGSVDLYAGANIDEALTGCCAASAASSSARLGCDVARPNMGRRRVPCDRIGSAFSVTANGAPRQERGETLRYPAQAVTERSGRLAVIAQPAFHCPKATSRTALITGDNASANGCAADAAPRRLDPRS
jgi:tetratricopeptide (TPR) repeat protein